MLFAFWNESERFQPIVGAIISTVRWQHAPGDFKEAVVFSETLDNDVDHARPILDLIREAEVVLKINECEFFIRLIT